MPEEPVDPRADKFTDGEIISTENEYRSERISISCSTVREDKLVYHVAEIYLRDVEYLRTAFASGGFLGMEGLQTQPFAEIAADNHAIVALAGDYYSARYEGVVICNGVLYRDTPNESVCVIWRDGRMECIEAEDYDPAKLIEGSA